MAHPRFVSAGNCVDRASMQHRPSLGGSGEISEGSDEAKAKGSVHGAWRCFLAGMRPHSSQLCTASFFRCSVNTDSDTSSVMMTSLDSAALDW